MAMSRSLGEGKIGRMVKKYAFIQDDRLGTVFFPLSAANVISNDLSDLRDKFVNDEIVIFTAQKQTQIQNDCGYVANSVIKKRELVPCTGKIVEVFEKFCYAEVKKYGRVFVPFSARNEANGNKAWLGKQGELGRVLQLRIFRQPDINQCKYVAWSIIIEDDFLCKAKSNSALKGSNINDKVLDAVPAQTGVIVTFPHNGDGSIYCAQTGLARLSHSDKRSWMQLGRFVKYDAFNVKSPDSKATWLAKNVEDLGSLYNVTDDYLDSSRFYLVDIPAVVNRVAANSRCAWLWNDFIGRIYVPPGNYTRGLRAMTAVRVRALYTGAFEDVPWSAQQLKVIGDDDDIRLANAQYLLTDDNWIVKFIQNQQQTFFGFMDHPKYGAAFIAWTDLTEGDQPPAPGTKCRATVYHQQRDRKHEWRAVLVTPVGSDGLPSVHHPMYLHTGIAHMPHPIEPPYCPPFLMDNNSMPPLVNRAQISPSKLPNPIAAPLISSAPSPPIFMDDQSSTVVSSPAPRVQSSGSSDSLVSETTESGTDIDLGLLSAFHWKSADFLPWTPRASSNNVMTNGVINEPSLLNNLSFHHLNISAKSFSECSTQTDMLDEQIVLRDIVNNQELLVEMIRKFPQHHERILNMRWQLSNY